MADVVLCTPDQKLCDYYKAQNDNLIREKTVMKRINLFFKCVLKKVVLLHSLGIIVFLNKITEKIKKTSVVKIRNLFCLYNKSFQSL